MQAERSLGGGTPEDLIGGRIVEPDLVEDLRLGHRPGPADTPDPETFDMDAFVAGVRPTRRSVKLYPHAHLLARMDEIADAIENTPADDNVDHLIDEFERCKRDYLTGVTFTVEKRSSEWEREFRKDVIRDFKLKVQMPKETNDLQGLPDDRAQVILRQLAAQIVVPAGVTYDQLRKLEHANEGELTKLLELQRQVNTVRAEASTVMGLDFSQRRSGSRATPRS